MPSRALMGLLYVEVNCSSHLELDKVFTLNIKLYQEGFVLKLLLIVQNNVPTGRIL